MTSREHARGVVDYWYDGTGIDEDTKNSMALVIERAIDAAVIEAVATERLFNAKAADDYGMPGLADYIRNGGAK